MNKIMLLIAFLGYFPLVNNSNTNIVELPNQFNGIPFSIENIIYVETLDSSIIVSCVIEKEMNFVDLISNYQSLRKIYGHGMFELNHNMEIIKSRFYLFKIKNAPDRFIYVTSENDPIPNTILADHFSSVDGQTHMDSVVKLKQQTLFDHFENEIIYSKGLILDFERTEFIVLDKEDVSDEGEGVYYEKDVFYQAIDDHFDNSTKVYWEKAYEPISFFDGQVFGFHQLTNKEDKSQKMSHFLNHDLSIFDSEGYLIQSHQLSWEKPMMISNATKVYQSNKLSDENMDAESGLYLLREQSTNSVKPAPVKDSYHILQFDKNGDQLLSIPFESELIYKHKDYGLAASQEGTNLLMAEFSLHTSGSSHTARANFHWFNDHKLVNADSRRMTFEMEPIFKDPSILSVKHRGSFDLDRNQKCVVYEMEETTEIHLQQIEQKDYFKTWFAFLVYNEHCKVVDFSITEGYIPADEKGELSKMTCSEDEMVFSLVRPNYFINSSKFEVVAKELSIVKVDKTTGKIQNYNANIDIELRQ